MSITLRFVTCHDIVSAAIRTYEYGFWTSHVEAKISTHVRVPRSMPLARAVADYQKHRVKKLKKQGGT
jgi:hypothetical protein